MLNLNPIYYATHSKRTKCYRNIPRHDTRHQSPGHLEDTEDYRKLIEVLVSLREVMAENMQTKICTCHIYAYCIMPNHVHILIHEKDWTIGQCVKYIADKYVRYYNKKYGRIGLTCR